MSGYRTAAAPALLMLALAGCSAGKSPDNASAGYRHTVGGPFTMIDQNRHVITDRTLAGKPFAIFFGFTRCPEVCPTTMNRLAQLRRKLGVDGDRFNIVFVSVDPEHDKPEDLKSFLSMFDTPAMGLTGNAVQTAGIVKDYNVFYQRVPLPNGDYTIDHTATVYFMDGQGQFVTTLDVHEPDRTAIEKLKRLIAA